MIFREYYIRIAKAERRGLGLGAPFDGGRQGVRRVRQGIFVKARTRQTKFVGVCVLTTSS